MSIKKKDREKIDGLIDSYVNAYKLCFNREYTNKYLDRFANMKYESSLYNSYKIIPSFPVKLLKTTSYLGLFTLEVILDSSSKFVKVYFK